MGIKFGVAGNSDSFYAEGNKASEQMPAFLAGKGLDAEGLGREAVCLGQGSQ